MLKDHHYTLRVEWTGNSGQGTRTYSGYSRNHEVTIQGKPMLPVSSDPSFRGDATRYNPEELLLASIASCHMLWFLHLCSENNIVVERYSDNPTARMQETADGGGHFTEAVLHPEVIVSAGATGAVDRLHIRAHQLCFVAQSLNFPVRCEGQVISAKE